MAQEASNENTSGGLPNGSKKTEVPLSSNLLPELEPDDPWYNLSDSRKRRESQNFNARTP